MIDVYENLIALTDCDGFRVDTVKHVDIDFWQTFCPAVRSYANSIGKDNFFMFAEVYSGMDGDVGYFT
jgi:glycosidase